MLLTLSQQTGKQSSHGTLHQDIRFAIFSVEQVASRTATEGVGGSHTTDQQHPAPPAAPADSLSWMNPTLSLELSAPVPTGPTNPQATPGLPLDLLGSEPIDQSVPLTESFDDWSWIDPELQLEDMLGLVPLEHSTPLAGLVKDVSRAGARHISRIHRALLGLPKKRAKKNSTLHSHHPMRNTTACLGPTNQSRSSCRTSANLSPNQTPTRTFWSVQHESLRS